MEDHMRYVKKVESTIKNGVNAELGPKTIIIGPNGSGKSAVVNAIELALTGRASDVAGRDVVAQDLALLSLAPGRNSAVTSEATLSDGSKCSWTTRPNGKGGATKAL